MIKNWPKGSETMINRQIFPIKKEGGEHVVLTWENDVWFGAASGGETPGLTGTRSRWPSPTSGWGRQGSLTAGRWPPPTLPSSSGQLSLHCNENPIYLFPEKELPVLSPNLHIQVSVRDLYIPNPYSSGQLTWNHPQDQWWGIRKYFFPIRIHGSVILNSGSGSYLDIFVANENTICCQIDWKLS